jgi:hypothetical protein
VSLRARGLAAVAAAALAATLALPVMSSGASFNSLSANPGNTVTADSGDNYVHAYSQGTDPAGLLGFAIKRLTVPPQPAATGVDASLAVSLGGLKNANAIPFLRVITLEARNPLPAGASPITVTATLAADPTTGRQPISGVTFSNLDGSGSAATATLAAGDEKQLNLTVNTQAFPGNNVLYRPTITLTYTFPGYTDTFLNVVIPVTVWDGNGAGP